MRKYSYIICHMTHSGSLSHWKWICRQKYFNSFLRDLYYFYICVKYYISNIRVEIRFIYFFVFRTSALRSSQNSLHSSVITNSQRPSSAYYPPPNTNSTTRTNNLHQSIPNLKSSPSANRLHNEELHQSIPNLKSVSDGRTGGSYPNVQYGQQNYYPQYMRPQQQTQQTNYPNSEEMKMGYSNPYGGKEAC